MTRYHYEPFSKAVATKFLTSQADSLVIRARNSADFLATQFVLREARLINRSASAAWCGIGGRFPVALWLAGQMSAAGAYTDDTTDAQDAGAGDFALDVQSTNNAGFALFSLVPFNIVSIVTSQAGSGGTPAWDLRYTKAGGSWGTITNAYVMPDFSGAPGEYLIWFESPTDWAVSEAGHGTNVPTGYYGINVRATTAPTAAASLATLITLGYMVRAMELGAAGGVGDLIEDEEVPLPPQCDALCAAFATAHVQNYASGLFRFKG